MWLRLAIAAVQVLCMIRLEMFAAFDHSHATLHALLGIHQTKQRVQCSFWQ